MAASRTKLDVLLTGICDAFVVFFGLWGFISLAVVQAQGRGETLAKLAILIPFLAAAILLWISKTSRRPRSSPVAVGRPVDIPKGPAKPDIPAFIGAVVLSLFYVFSSHYVLFWSGSLVFLGVFYLSRIKSPPMRPARTEASPAETVVLALLACAVLFMTLCVHRPHPDDSLYLSVAVEAHDHPELPLMSRDTLHGIPGMPFLAPQHRFRTYDVLVGQVSRLLGIKPIAAAHILFPPLFALVFLAATARLLRFLLGRAWLFGLAAVVLILVVNGDMETTYGNSGLILLFQGRGVLATVMVPLLACYGLEYMTGPRPGRAVWPLLLLGQAAVLCFSTNGLFVGPITAGLSMAAAWRPDLRASLRLAAGALTLVYPLAMGMFLRSGSVPGQFYAVAAPSWKLVAERSLNHVLGWRPFMAFWLTAFLGGWTFLPERTLRRWMLGFSFLFLALIMNPLLTRFWAVYLTSVVTFFRVYWALPLPVFLAALLAGALFAWRGLKGRGLRAAVFSVALAGFALFVPARWTTAPSNNARLGPPGLNVPQTFYAVAEQAASSTPRNALVLAPETVAAWIPTISGHPASVVSRRMHLQQQRSRMDEEEYRRRLALFLYIGGVKKPISADQLDELFARSVGELQIRTVIVTRSNPWLSEIELMLRRQGFIRQTSPSRHFLTYVLPEPVRPQPFI